MLCRTNEDYARIADELMKQGYTVSLAKSGLLQTPETLFAVACLKRLLDPSDTLATAEIIALEGKMTPEEWLENRLIYMEKARAKNLDSRGAEWGSEENLIHPIIVSLEQARTALDNRAIMPAIHSSTSGSISGSNQSTFRPKSRDILGVQSD